MLIVRVLQPETAARTGLQARFDARGGSLGRSAECTLTLPDPSKHISRVQAELRWTGSGWVLVNLSEVNPVVVNGLEVPPRGSSRIMHGDRIGIADYVLGVEDAPDAVGAGDPFADLLPGSAPAGPGVDRPVAPAVDAPWPDDIFAGLEGLAAPSGVPAVSHEKRPTAAADPDPLDIFRMPGPSAELHAVGRASRGEPPAGGSWSGGDPLDGRNAGPGQGRDDRNSVPGSGDPSIDELFGLSAGPPPLDPLAPSPAAPPGMSGDRFQIASDASMSDHAPELRAPIRLPRFESGPGASEPTPARGAAARPEAASFRSWEAPEDVPRTTIVVRGQAPEAPAQPGRRQPAGPVGPGARPPADAFPEIRPGPSEPSPDEPADPGSPAAIVERLAQAYPRSFDPPPLTRPTELLDGLNRAAVAAAPGGSREGSSPADTSDAVYAALLRGAGLADLPRVTGAASQAAVAYRAGELLALAIGGVVDQLSARARFKHELRSKVTTIAARDNNPLKFSPDAAAALEQLLTPAPSRAFMDGPAAMRDAFDDLLAHQIAMVSSMRAALQSLATRFDPEALAGQFEKRATLLDSMLPMARKARLWELFGELYDEISRDAREDFEELFSTEFVRAYEEHLLQLERGRGR
jgi:FHA domain-containing protein